MLTFANLRLTSSASLHLSSVGQWPRVWCRSRYPGQCSYFIQVSAAGWRLDTEYGNIPLIISSHIQQNTPHSGYSASSATHPQLRSRSFSSPDLVCEFAALQSAASSLCRLETSSTHHFSTLHICYSEQQASCG